MTKTDFPVLDPTCVQRRTDSVVYVCANFLIRTWKPLQPYCPTIDAVDTSYAGFTLCAATLEAVLLLDEDRREIVDHLQTVAIVVPGRMVVA